jgi:hypothetical protein
MRKLNVGVVIGILLVAGTAWSSPLFLTVNDPSFETPVLSAANAVTPEGAQGWFAFNQIFAGTGWRTDAGTNTAGILQPILGASPLAFTTMAATAGSGSQVAFARAGGFIYQDLVALNSFGSFTVTVDVGRNATVASAPYTISLLSVASGGSTTVLGSMTGDVSTIAAGNWASQSFTFSGPTITNQMLRVQLSSAAGQVDFDNVSVHNNAPEIGGSAVFWTMFGVAGLFLYGKKRLAA